MPLDALCLRALVHELTPQLIGSRVEKIYQPDRDEVVLALRGGAAGACRLLLTAAPSAPRMQLIAQNRENPATPPMFCMLMRKYLQGGKLREIQQPDGERIATLVFDTTDEMGERVTRSLVCELMGRYSNIILCGSDGRIIDAVRRVDGDISGKRQILPGLYYRDPPAQEHKVNPYTISPAGFQAALAVADGAQRLDKWLLSSFFGLSPLLSRELSHRATGDTAVQISQLSEAQKAHVCEVYFDFIHNLLENGGKPYLLTKTEDKAVFDFSMVPIAQYENAATVAQVASFSDLFTQFYEKKARHERMNRKAGEMLRTVTAARDRLLRKLSAQQEEILQTQNREHNRHMGELIMANLYQLEKGMHSVNVINYFEESCPTVEITLDLRYTPQQNAQRYFKLYTKAKTAEQMLTQQIAHGEQELQYLESVLEAVEQAENEADFAQLHEELVQTGVLSNKQKKGARQKPAKSAPYEYCTTDGFSVWAGKNNLQNDLLSLKTAYKTDMWFHTQKLHGSHVILVCDGQTPSDEAMTQAAMIAAYHSKGRTSSLVPVDYTAVRNLKKPNGSKPGFVIYHVYQTAYVTVDEAAVEALRIKR